MKYIVEHLLLSGPQGLLFFHLLFLSSSEVIIHSLLLICFLISFFISFFISLLTCFIIYSIICFLKHSPPVINQPLISSFMLTFLDPSVTHRMTVDRNQSPSSTVFQDFHAYASKKVSTFRKKLA
jgi:hypothetical protein